MVGARHKGSQYSHAAKKDTREAFTPIGSWKLSREGQTCIKERCTKTERRAKGDARMRGKRDGIYISK